MKWEAPPPEGNLYSGSKKNAYEEEAQELRDHPGEWGVVVEFPLKRTDNVKENNPARGVANNIRKGNYVAFRNGKFEAVSRIGKNDQGEDVVKVHARYIPFSGGQG